MFSKDLKDHVRDSGRLTTRLLTEHFLREMAILSRIHDGDVIRGIIYTGILSANTRTIMENPDLSRLYGGLDDMPPDDVRVPISVNALAQSLGIPYETTRRYVKELIKAGLCEQIGRRGVIIPRQAIMRTADEGVVEELFICLRRLIASLRKAGFDLNTLG